MVASASSGMHNGGCRVFQRRYNRSLMPPVSGGGGYQEETATSSCPVPSPSPPVSSPSLLSVSPQEVLATHGSSSCKCHEVPSPQYQQRQQQRVRPQQHAPISASYQRGRVGSSGSCSSSDGSGARNAGSSNRLSISGTHLDDESRDRHMALLEAEVELWKRRYEVQAKLTEDTSKSGRVAAERAQRSAEAGRKAAIAEVKELKSVLARQQEAANEVESKLRRELAELLVKLKLSSEDAEKPAVVSLQTIITQLGKALMEVISSLGELRLAPTDAEFNAKVTELLEIAECAGKGFLSVDSLHSAAQNSRALVLAHSSIRELQAELTSRSSGHTAEAARHGREVGELEHKLDTCLLESKRLKDDLISERRSNDELAVKLQVTEDALRKATRMPAPRLNMSNDGVNYGAIFEEGLRVMKKGMEAKARATVEEVEALHALSQTEIESIKNAIA